MVRTRLAPSPTGLLHIGTARTALFNYLFAKRHAGSFILRVEDTDRDRSRKEFEDDILDGLAWLNIAWDEGPCVGGAYGPYYQSQRIDIYTQYLKILWGKGLLYRCFCTKEELERERELQTLSHQPPKYSGKCRLLSEQELARSVEEGRPSTLRFKVDPRIIEISDLVRGELRFDTSTLDDFIIAKDFTTPLYNFAVVVDDFLMKITHVIRGEEHISNIPKQVLLADALGFSLPEFAHLSLILNPDRTKLSKRQNKVSLLEYREDGYLPQAIVNFSALLGWNPGGTRELFTLTEIAALFDLLHVHKAGAVFDVAKLDWFNNNYIRQLSEDDLLDHVTRALCRAGTITPAENLCYTVAKTGESIDTEFIRAIAILERDRLKKFADLPASSSFFFENILEYSPDLLLWKDMERDPIRASLAFAEEQIEALSDFSAAAIESAIKNAIANAGKKNGEILWPLRVALTGQKFSPPPFAVAAILGKEKTIDRIRAARAKLS